jgi:hypothetical protein
VAWRVEGFIVVVYTVGGNEAEDAGWQYHSRTVEDPAAGSAVNPLKTNSSVAAKTSGSRNRMAKAKFLENIIGQQQR